MAANSHLGGAGLPDVSQGPQILAATSITTIVALLVVLARIYVRVFVIQNAGLDVGLKASVANGRVVSSNPYLGLYHGPDHGTGNRPRERT